MVEFFFREEHVVNSACVLKSIDLNLWQMNFCKPSYVRRCGCRHGVLCCISCLLMVVFITLMVPMKSGLYVIDNSLLQLEKCPVCFGIWESVCQGIASGALKIRRNYFWTRNSDKGVWYGEWNNLLVMVKRLGHSYELDMLDQEICLNTTNPATKYCNVHEEVWRSFLNPPKAFRSAIVQFMECPSQQFARLVENKLKNKMNVVQLHQKIMATTNIHFNHEFLFLQVFSKRYPNFLPAVYGACGRVIVVEYVGPSLSSVLGRPWRERVNLSIKLIQLARTFTRTEDNMALYMYDVVLNNFAVDEHSNVKLIDCEHVVIVDMSSFNRTYVNKAEDFCAADRFQCLTFVPEDLCAGEAQDHNYYAICRNILAAVGGSRGLLHSPPDDAHARINYLLSNCVYSKDISREQAIDKLEKELYKFITV